MKLSIFTVTVTLAKKKKNSQDTPAYVMYYHSLVAKGSELKQSYDPCDLEDSYPFVLHNTPAYDDVASYQVRLQKVQMLRCHWTNNKKFECSL